MPSRLSPNDSSSAFSALFVRRVSGLGLCPKGAVPEPDPFLGSSDRPDI